MTADAVKRTAILSITMKPDDRVRLHEVAEMAFMTDSTWALKVLLEEIDRQPKGRKLRRAV